MIPPSHPKWRAVRVENRASVEHLNRMFKAGWYLEVIDIDGLRTLSFEVPLSPVPVKERARTVMTLNWDQPVSAMSIVILRKGADRGLQRAVYLMRNEEGRFDIGAVSIDDGPWGMVEMINLEDGNKALIFQRGLTASIHAFPRKKS